MEGFPSGSLPLYCLHFFCINIVIILFLANRLACLLAYRLYWKQKSTTRRRCVCTRISASSATRDFTSTTSTVTTPSDCISFSTDFHVSRQQDPTVWTEWSPTFFLNDLTVNSLLPLCDPAILRTCAVTYSMRNTLKHADLNYSEGAFAPNYGLEKFFLFSHPLGANNPLSPF